MAIGELVVDWISTTKGKGFIESSTYFKSLGGNAANVAIGLSRLGSPSKLIAKTGNDVQSRYLLKVLEEEGVDTEHIIADPAYPTAQCYVFTTVDDDNTFLNWPSGNAAQWLESDEITEEIMDGIDLIHATGISLTSEPRRAAILKALEMAHRRDLVVSFDAGFPTGEGEEARESVKKAMAHADIIKVNMLELIFWNRQIAPELARSIPAEITKLYDNPPSSGHEETSSKSAVDIPAQLLEDLSGTLFERYKPAVLLVTLAEKGSYIFSEGERLMIPPFKVETVAGVGAGDAYMAGFLHYLKETQRKDVGLNEHLRTMSKEELKTTGIFASAVGALTTRSISAHESLPTRDEVETLVKSAPHQ